MQKNQKKSKVLKILKDQKEDMLIKLVDSMTSKDIDDLYFLLTSDDKKKIEQFSRNKEAEIQKQFAQLQGIEVQSKQNLSKLYNN